MTWYVFGSGVTMACDFDHCDSHLESVGLFLFQSECRAPGAGRYDIGLAGNTKDGSGCP